MGKRLPYTPRSKIRNVLRRYIWLRSRERAAALKREKYHCQRCKGKQSKAKGREFSLEVHHLDGAHTEYIIDEIYKYLLCNPDRLEVLCVKCHDKNHTKEK
jgi:5-methylcytosine-specific restriction endonuclease McrA